MVVIVMGVSGSGKSTVGSLLARELGWSFYDADAFHPPENVEKMAAGRPLTDRDRQPWLQALHSLVVELLDSGENAVLACSALKASYRRLLLVGQPGVELVYLQGSPELIRERLGGRSGHFFSSGLLASQFADLEEPEGARVVRVDRPPQEIAADLADWLRVMEGLGAG